MDNQQFPILFDDIYNQIDLNSNINNNIDSYINKRISLNIPNDLEEPILSEQSDNKEKELTGDVYLIPLIYLSTLFPLAIISVLFGYIYSDTSCYKTYIGLVFNYNTWLFIDGFTTMATSFIIIYMMFYTNKYLYLNHIFHAIWCIVGFVLYYMTIYSDCEHSNSTIFFFAF